MHATPVELVPLILVSSAEDKFSTGYVIRKGLNYDQAQCANGGGYTGAIVFRAVESYLNYIEAYYERNGSLNGKAQAYWQAIRNRAGVDPDFNKTIAATDMDYSVYDAVKAGFGKIVFVIRHHFEKDFQEQIIPRYKNLIPVEVVFQEIEYIPEGIDYNKERSKPWGTNHGKTPVLRTSEEEQ